MTNLGKTIRILRKSKNMTLAQLADGIVSLPFLSKYERNNSNISASNFLSLLDRLNVNLREFEELNSSGKEYSQKIFFKNYREALISDDLFLLNKLLNQEKKYLELDGNYRHKHNIILINQYINKISGLPFDNNQVKLITNYLLQVEDWSYYELSLFGNSLFSLPIDSIDFLCKVAFKKASLFSDIFSLKNDLALIACNVIILMIEQDELHRLDSLFLLADRNLENTRFYYEKNKVNYLKGLYEIKKGNIEVGKQHCMKAIETMYSLGDNINAKAHQEELKKYLN